METAAPGEVVVSSTVKDLVAGSGLSCTDRGVHVLKGVPGEWRLFAVERCGYGEYRRPSMGVRSALIFGAEGGLPWDCVSS